MSIIKEKKKLGLTNKLANYKKKNDKLEERNRALQIELTQTRQELSTLKLNIKIEIKNEIDEYMKKYAEAEQEREDRLFQRLQQRQENTQQRSNQNQGQEQEPPSGKNLSFNS